MTKLNGIYALAIAGVTALGGCGRIQEVSQKTAEVIELQGNYQTMVQDELSVRANGIGCVVHQLSFTGLDMTIVQTTFADRGCTGNPLGEVKFEGTAAIGGELPIAPGARALDLTINKVTVTPLADNWMKLLGLDASGNCNITDVPVGQAREVTGLNCGAIGQLPGKGAIFFTSYVLNGEEMRFTQLPNELPQHVGTKDRPADRAQDLKVVYHPKK